ERLDERRIRQPAGPQRQASPRQDQRARGRGAARRRFDEPGLADPGLAGDDRQPGLTGDGTRERGGEPSELGFPSDESPAGSDIHDPAMIGAPPASANTGVTRRYRPSRAAGATGHAPGTGASSSRPR